MGDPVDVKTYFSPIRMVAGQKDPVILEVAIKNSTQESQLVTVIVKMPFSLGFDRVGLMREKLKRIGYVKAGAEKTVPVQIYGKPMIREGEYPVDVRVIYHPERYDKTENEVRQTTTLRVIGK